MSAERAPQAVASAPPAVVASVGAGIRRLLIDRGRWDEVRARMLELEPRSADWIDAPVPAKWVPFERHALVMRALQDTIGDEGLRDLGRQRMREALSGGVLAPLFRSWARSYAGAPGQMLRVTPHAWRAATSGLGRMVVASAREREMVIRVVGAPDALRRAEAWHRFLEGYGQGVLEIGDRQGACVIEPAGDGIVGTFRW